MKQLLLATLGKQETEKRKRLLAQSQCQWLLMVISHFVLCVFPLMSGFV